MSQAERPKRCVASLMRRHFVALSPDDSLDDAAATLRVTRARALPVLAEGRLAGLLRHGVVLHALLARGAEEPGSERLRRVGELLGPALRTLTPELSLAEAAARLCAAGGGFLPVIEAGGGAVLGIVTESDLLRVAYREEGGSSSAPLEPGPGRSGAASSS